MKASQSIRQYLKNIEGLRLKKEWDRDHWVIGYGHTRTAAGFTTITKEQADFLFDQDLASFENYVNTWMQRTGIRLNQNQFDAMVSFTYNLGSISANLTKAIREGKAYQKIQEFVYDNGIKLPGLVARRKYEAELFTTPDYKKVLPWLAALLYI